MAESLGDATTRLAEYALDLDVEAIPEDVVTKARVILADTVGVLLGASTRRAVHTAISALAPAGTGRCTIIGHGRDASPEVAAFVNGIGGHDIELDDYNPARTHTAAVVVPAALVAAEVAERCTYGELLASIIAAYDVQHRVVKAIGQEELFDRGFHPSTVTGSVGTAVAAGRILGLSLEEMRKCISLAASQSCGLLTYYDDATHMQKSFQTGVATRNGLTAALFARAGYGAAPDPLTGETANLVRAFSGPTTDERKLTVDLGVLYELSDTCIKRHASCGLTHSSVDAMISLLEDTRITADKIVKIDVQLPHKAAPRIDGNALWTHNVQYVLALVAHERRVGLEHFTSQYTTNPEILRLADTVTVRGSDELQAQFPDKKGAIVTVTTLDGEFVSRCDAARGYPGDPLTEGEVADKFRHLAGMVLDPDAAGALWDTLARAQLGDTVDGRLFDTLATNPGA